MMEHLTFDEIVGFVTSGQLDHKTVLLSARVNGHIRRCEKCFRLVKAFQQVADGFNEISTAEDIRRALCNRLAKEKAEQDLESCDIIDDAKDFR